MQIAIGSDHAGYSLKEILKVHLKDLGHETSDLGTFSEESVDYPIYAEKVGIAVSSGSADFGVLVCGTGIGVSIAANKVKGVRAGVVHDTTSARLAREHNNANIVCFGARLVGVEVAKDALESFLSSNFLGGRHERRIEEITEMERNG